MERFAFVIIGAGHAACVAALKIRELSPEESILVIGEEPFPPYERPALSKDVLAGTRPASTVIIKTEDELREKGITTRLGRRVTAIDVARRTVTLGGDDQVGYRKLLIATGSRARPLPGTPPDLPHVHYLRGLKDVEALRSDLARGGHLIVIGAGFVGLEVAATAREHFGCHVTVIENGPGILTRGATPELRTALSDLHRDHGVRFLFDTVVSAIGARGPDAVEVRTTDGDALVGDAVLVCIGAIANTELAEAAGIATENGILTDAFGATGVEGVWAAGEVARHPLASRSQPVRFESWQMAQTQAASVAENMTGAGVPIDYVPWFWTDQYGHNFQLIGDLKPGAETLTRQYDTNGCSTTIYVSNREIVGAICMDRGQDIPPLRRAIAGNARVDAVLFSDPTQKLKNALIRPPDPETPRSSTAIKDKEEQNG